MGVDGMFGGARWGGRAYLWVYARQPGVPITRRLRSAIPNVVAGVRRRLARHTGSMPVNPHRCFSFAGRQAAGFHPPFASAAGLRALLETAARGWCGAWREDPEASALLAYTIERYAPLARSWHRDPGEAGSAAFLAMRNDGVRRAADPWAVLTRAVQISLSAESHAERHLTSTDEGQARAARAARDAAADWRARRDSHRRDRWRGGQGAARRSR